MKALKKNPFAIGDKVITPISDREGEIVAISTTRHNYFIDIYGKLAANEFTVRLPMPAIRAARFLTVEVKCLEGDLRRA